MKKYGESNDMKALVMQKTIIELWKINRDEWHSSGECDVVCTESMVSFIFHICFMAHAL
jgi:hypothetical protein